MGLTEALIELARLTPTAVLLWRQHMANEGVAIDASKAVHVWFTLEHDTFYDGPVWSANWVYFDSEGRTTTFLHEGGNTPLEAAIALLRRTKV